MPTSRGDMTPEEAFGVLSRDVLHDGDVRGILRGLARLSPELAQQGADIVLKNPAYSGFKAKQLASRLKASRSPAAPFSQLVQELSRDE